MLHDSVFNCCTRRQKLFLDEFHAFLDQPIELFEGLDLEIIINKQPFHKSILLQEVDILARIVKKNWNVIQGSAIYDMGVVPFEELKNCRETINKCLSSIVLGLESVEDLVVKAQTGLAVTRNFQQIASLILPISEWGKEIQLINKSNLCPIYQFFHTRFDIYYYFLLLGYLSGDVVNFKKQIDVYIVELVTLGESGYRKNAQSGFTCPCIKDFWVVINTLCNRLTEADYFWTIFNKTLQNHNPEFILWLLKDIAELQGQTPNFTLLETTLKQILSNPNDSILATLQLIEPLVCKIWLISARIEIYQILWDFFSRRLNLRSQSSIDLTFPQLITVIDNLLNVSSKCDIDFELFLSMLQMHLTEHPFHWGKMKGRIYSQLGPNKIKELHITGIFNVLLMFLSLTRINFDELVKKFVGVVETLTTEKRQTDVVWGFYAALVIRHIKENRSIKSISPLFIKLSDEVVTRPELFHCLKKFVSDFRTIIEVSSSLQLDQSLLLHSWIYKYMQTCYHPDLVSFLEVMCYTLEKVTNLEVWSDWETSFKNYVYPSLEIVSASRSAPPDCGVLAGKVSVLSPEVLPRSFQFFNAENINVGVSSGFLCEVLQPCNGVMLTTQQEVLAVRTWAKVCFLSREDSTQLTGIIISMNCIPEVIRKAVRGANDPLIAVIDGLGDEVSRQAQNPALVRFADLFFGQADGFLKKYLAQPEKEVVVLRIFTCLGLTFHKLGSLLYSKHKANCPFERIVTAVLLPSEVLIGKNVNQHILSSVKKTWGLFFSTAVKLNDGSDPYIERILREMIIKYIPYYATVDSPIFKSLDHDFLAEIVLGNLAAAFFKHPSKEAESSVAKALKIVNEFVKGSTSTKLLQLIVNKTVYGLCEIVMFNNNKRLTALDIIKNITMSVVFSQLKKSFYDVIIEIADKNLAFNTPSFFQLLEQLAKLKSCDLTEIMPQIREKIVNVERMRGVGFDKTLRLYLGRLESNLLKLSQ